MNKDTSIEETQKTLSDVQAILDREGEERKDLERRFTQLSSKLAYPGTQFLIDLEYKLLYDAVLTVPASSAVSSAIIETLPGTLHAVYVMSAYCADSSVSIICDGSGVDLVGIHTHLVRSRGTLPTRIDVTVRLRNTSVTERDVAVRVWRRLGLGN